MLNLERHGYVIALNNGDILQLKDGGNKIYRFKLFALIASLKYPESKILNCFYKKIF
jgi:hypothetical protein